MIYNLGNLKRCEFTQHGDFGVIDGSFIILRQTPEQVIQSFNHDYDMNDIYQMYDQAEDGTPIQYIYTLTEIGGELSCYCGVEYTDGRFAIVGCRQSRMIKNYKQMIKNMTCGF